MAELLEASATTRPITADERVHLEWAISILRSLKPECVGHLWKRFILGIDFAEIGTEIGLSEAAARMAVKRCLELIQKVVMK